jgi:hypothetical protein
MNCCIRDGDEIVQECKAGRLPELWVCSEGWFRRRTQSRRVEGSHEVRYLKSGSGMYRQPRRLEET